MKTYSNKQIIAEVKKLVEDKDNKTGLSHYVTIEVPVNKKDEVQIHFENMYEYCPMSFKMLQGLAEFFNTKNINDDDRYHTDGCETCDYGSVYKFTLTIRPEKNNS